MPSSSNNLSVVAESIVTNGTIHQTMPHLCEIYTSCQKPMHSSELPKYPWQKVATDHFELNKQSYLLVVDYYSRYPEVIKLNSTTSASIVSAMKTIFSRHGIPQTVISDNGLQYDSSEMKIFSSTYGFKHVLITCKGMVLLNAWLRL